MKRIDLNINHDVKRVLIRHRIDLGLLTIRTTGQICWIQGTLDRMKGFPEKLTPNTVKIIFAEIKHVKHLKYYKTHLDNWENNGYWRNTKSKAK
jgi:hypothetical protein